MIFIDVDDYFFVVINYCLMMCGVFFDLQFGQIVFYCFGYIVYFFDFFDQGLCFFCKFVGQVFDIIGFCQWIDDFGDVGFFLQDQLGIMGDMCVEFGWQCNCFVECIGME